MSLPLFDTAVTFRARAVSNGFGLSSKDTQQIAAVMEIVDDENYAGETITWIGHFSDKTAARTIESLQHMGWKGDDLSELEDLDRAACAEKLPDVIEIVVEQEEVPPNDDGTGGGWRNRVRWVNRPGGGRFAFKKPLVGADLKAFAAQMRATVKGVRGAGGAPRQSAPSGGGNNSRPSSGGYGNSPHPNAPGNDSDIPF